MWILGGPGVSQTPSASKVKRWRWLRTTDIWRFIWLSSRSNITDCSSQGNLGFQDVAYLLQVCGGEFHLLCKKAGSVLGTALDPIVKGQKDNTAHTLQKIEQKQLSEFSQRLLQLRCKADGYIYIYIYKKATYRLLDYLLK